MDLIYLFKVLARNKWLIIGITAVGIAAGLFFTRNTEKHYKSEALIATGFTVKNKVNYFEEKFNVFDASVKFTNLIEMMKSKSVVSLLSYHLMLHDLKNDEPFRNPYRKEDEEPVRLNEAEKEKAIKIFRDKLNNIELLSSYSKEEKKLLKLLEFYEYDYESLKKGLSVKRVNVSDFVSVEFISENPQLSAYAVNTLSKEFLRYNKFLSTSRTGESVEFLSNLVEETKKELDEKTEELKEYKSSHNVLDYETESEAKISKLNEYQKKREKVQDEVRSLRISLNNVNKRLEKLEQNNSSALNKNEKIVALREQINDLNQKYIDGGRRDKKLLRKINRLRKELQQELASAGGGSSDEEDIRELHQRKQQLELDLSIAESDLTSLNNQINQIQGNLSGFATHESKLKALEREVKVASDEYVRALDKYNAAKKASMASDNSIKVVLHGQPAGEAQPSKRYMIVGLSGASSFALTIIALIFITYLDVSIKTPTNFIKSTGLSLIGSVIHLDHKMVKNAFMVTSNSSGEKKDHFDEFLRKLRYEITKTGNRLFLMTSTKQGEGKSFLTVNLARSLSLTHKKILMIDTNFAHNTLTKHFNAKPALEKAVKNEEKDLEKIITATDNENVDIIGCKGGSYSPNEILENLKFTNLLESLKAKYDYIFFEGASLNDYSDSQELENYVEKIIPVFSARSAVNESDKSSIQYLSKLDNKMMGTILNNVEEENLEL